MGQWCGGGGNQETSTSTSQTRLPPQIRQALNASLQHAFAIGNQSYPRYNPRARVAPINRTQRQNFTRINQLARDRTPFANYNFAVRQARRYANAPAFDETVVDEDGRLGAVSRYMNPFLDEALNPAIREINENAARQRIGIGARATQAGAFGDARHGVVERGNYEDENQLVGDLTHQAYARAFDTAMGLRGSDLDRLMTGSERALDRGLAGGRAAMEYDAAQNAERMSRILASLGVGDRQQQQNQQVRNARYEEFLNAREWPFRQFDVLRGVMTGAPSANTVTSTTSQPGQNPIWQALGALAGSAF